MTTYSIVFTERGRPVRTWTGYATWADARRAIADADLVIPFHWDWTIAEVRRP
jgi:hypothetical protein